MHSFLLLPCEGQIQLLIAPLTRSLHRASRRDLLAGSLSAAGERLSNARVRFPLSPRVPESLYGWSLRRLLSLKLKTEIER
jgi:hypothetical protein